MDARDELIEILDYYKHKLLHGGCTMEEIDSVKRTIVENMEISGTIGDFADFYGKSKDAVNGIIKRNLIAKPRRNVVLYPFHKFRSIIPASWRRKP
jgi:hypothetical protein